MKINSLAYQDKTRNWQLDKVDFGSLTLLVGASGVGKTQILRALNHLTQIAYGASLNGLKWEVSFQVSSEEPAITWSGEFEDLGYEEEEIVFGNIIEDDNNNVIKPKIISECICQGVKTIVKRDDKDIYFEGNKTVRLAQNKSVLALIEEFPLHEIKRAWARVEVNDFTDARRKITQRDAEIDVNDYPDLWSIRESDETVRTKLYVCSQVVPHVYTEIINNFRDVFPFVEDVRVQPLDRGRIPNALRDIPFIQIKEKDVPQWIEESTISSGMYRTLLQISELYLCSDGTVFLIDEFENSLGINCIDDLTSALMSHGREIQFIITSHHPYIINNISYKNWKIITRKGGQVTAKDASDYNLGKSKHQAFIQLINLDVYSEGVEA